MRVAEYTTIEVRMPPHTELPAPEAFTAWFNEVLDAARMEAESQGDRWSEREFCRDTGIGQTWVTQIKQGRIPSEEHIIRKIAQRAMKLPSFENDSEEYVLALAGKAPDHHRHRDYSPEARRLLRELDNLSDEERQLALQALDLILQPYRARKGGS
jgi:hypothetical protein